MTVIYEIYHTVSGRGSSNLHFNLSYQPRIIPQNCTGSVFELKKNNTYTFFTRCMRFRNLARLAQSVIQDMRSCFRPLLMSKNYEIQMLTIFIYFVYLSFIWPKVLYAKNDFYAKMQMIWIYLFVKADEKNIIQYLHLNNAITYLQNH